MNKCFGFGIVSILGCFLLLSCSTISEDLSRRPSSESAAQGLPQKPRHYVFLIHGIAGDRTHFGYMKEALAYELPTFDPGDWIIETFDYDTQNDTKDVFQFALDFNNYLKSYFSSQAPLTERDRISIVTHSQGGILASIWLLNSFSGAGEFTTGFHRHVDAFITLGTPFWGSKLATLTDRIAKNGKWMSRVVDPVPLFGNKQLEDLSFGSSIVFDFRRTLTGADKASVLNTMKAQVRALNIAGVIKENSILRNFTIRHADYEDDMAVPLPSANLDFIYADLSKPYDRNEKTSYKAFESTDFSDLISVPAVHWLPPPLQKKLPSVCQIPESCIRNVECGHPTFKIVLWHLLKKPLTKEREFTKKMRSFMMDLTFSARNGATLNPKSLEVKIRPNREIRMSDKFEPYAKGSKTIVGHSNHLRFFASGYIPNAFQKGEFAAKIAEVTITHPGYKPRVIEIPLKATHTTYAHIILEP